MSSRLVSALLCSALAVLPPAAGQEETAAPAAGLLRREAAAEAGYVLFSPFRGALTYLIDPDGQVVHTWESDYPPGSPYLLENGHLLRSAKEPDPPVFEGGGQGGRVQEFTWDGELVWNFAFVSETHLQHHDIEPLPGGTVLLIAWEYKSVAEALAAGRHPELLEGLEGFWPDFLVEVRPEGADGGTIVWEWHAWDHLVQDLDESLPGYGSVADHPERIDVNADREREELTTEEIEDLEALGYLADAPPEREQQRGRSDWLHVNAVAYHTGLDQIALSVPRVNEIWILDHGTTREEAAGSAGGRRGRGGDLLYRWGNPQAYRRGGPTDQLLFFQHDVRWIPEGSPGAGNLTVFNNGRGRPDGSEYSSVLEIAPPLMADGRYRRDEDLPFGPAAPAWSYQDPGSFFSSFVSGTQRLPGGNTLVCSGADGRLFQVTPGGDIVWEYVNPFVAPDEEAEDGGPGEHPHGMFRATFLPPDHPGLAGRTLRPLDPQPDHAAARAPRS